MTIRNRTILVALLAGMPALTPAQSKEKERDATATTGRHITSWTADKREYQVGDVITILVSDATLASATKSQSGSDQQSRKNALDFVPPKVGTTALPTLDATLSTGKNATSAQTGDAKRNLSFRGDISVRVTAIDKSGQLAVKGTKVVDVDNNKQMLNFSGVIRPEDVSPDNLVQSERVADAQLTYELSGALGKTRGGLVGRLLNVFWP